MRLPSLRQLFDHSSQTFSRFPFALTSAIVGTGAWLIIIERTDSDASSLLENLALLGMMGISLFTGIVLVCEKLAVSRRSLLLANLGGVGALLLYYLALPEQVFAAPEGHMIRYVLFGAGLHFFIAVGPFFRSGETNGFWQFNKSLFLRFLTASLYSSVLYVGLAAALLAVDQLFDADIDAKRYGELWVLIVGVFNTWFFLSGVPDNFGQLDADTSYPKGLKIFTQYVLIPLVALYLVILYAYEIKIVTEWNWPKGWVGYLVLIFSILGLLSILLVHPIKDRIENAWIRFTSKYLYVALIPLVVLLLLAIWRRISEYGLTERRYFVVVLGLWLAGMIIYFLFSKAKSIKVIPATLFVIAFAVSFGPWGAMGLSEHIQLGRLSDVLTRTGILQAGKIHKATEEVTFHDQRRISSIIRYLDEVHGLQGVQPWFDVNLDTLGTLQDPSRSWTRYGTPPAVVALMGISYVDEWQTLESKTMSYNSAQTTVVEVGGFTHMVRDVSLSSWDSTETFTAHGIEWKISYNLASVTIDVTATKGATAHLLFDLKPLLSVLELEYGTIAYGSNIPSGKMTVERSDGAFTIKMNFRMISAVKVGDRYQGNQVQTDLFIGTSRPVLRNDK